jgi:hypothetical protein
VECVLNVVGYLRESLETYGEKIYFFVLTICVLLSVLYLGVGH